jgi:hypothetical protein
MRPSIIEGTIKSISTEGNYLVILASVTHVDTVLFDSMTILKSGDKPALLKDLKANQPVKVDYKLTAGRWKIYRILMQDAASTQAKGPEMVIAEATITSVNTASGTMILKAQLFQNDTVAVDSSATIKGEPAIKSFKDLKLDNYVRVHMPEAKGKKLMIDIITAGPREKAK